MIEDLEQQAVLAVFRLKMAYIEADLNEWLIAFSVASKSKAFKQTEYYKIIFNKVCELKLLLKEYDKQINEIITYGK